MRALTLLYGPGHLFITPNFTERSPLMQVFFNGENGEKNLGLEAPICRTIVDVLEGTPAQDAIRALMARDAGTE